MTVRDLVLKLAAWATVIAVALSFSPTGLFAQTTSGSIQGTVTDETGAIMPGVTVSVKNTETGIVRTVHTDELGRYFAPQLPLGQYQVQGELSGFRTTVRQGIVLTLNREAVVDLKLGVGSLTESIVVTGEAALVESTNAMVAGSVSAQQMTELPMNARSYVDLALLQPATIKVRNPGGGIGDEGTHITVAGSRPEETTFLLDGTVTTSTRGKAPSSAAGTALGVDSIREFVVITSPYNAEYGRGSGGTVSVVTKSGSNRVHGSLFGFHRNEALDARNYFDPADAALPDFARNQFGFSLGGKIVTNRTFYFGNFEGLRQEMGRTSIYRVPTEAGRRGILGTRTVTVNPALQPYLAFYPMPNGRDFGDGTGEYLTASNRATDEDLVTFRLDHQISSNHSIFGRYTLSNSSDVAPGNLNQFETTIGSRSQYVTVEQKSIFSSNLLNVLRFGFTRNNLTEAESDISGVSSAAFILQPGQLLPQINVTTLSGLGSLSTAPRYFINNTFEIYDSLNFTRGRHQMKAGVQFQLIHNNTENNTRQSGRWGFNSLETFLAGSANSFIIAPRELADPQREFRQKFLAAFIQDDIKLREDLTLNVGLRSEWAGTISETQGRIAWLPEDKLLSGTVDDLRTGDPWYQNPGVTFAPRVGLAWKPFGSDKTSIRGGAGLFYDHIWSWWQSGSGAYRTAPYYSVVNFNETIQFPKSMEYFMDLLRVRQNRAVPAGNEVGHTVTDPEKIKVMQYSVDFQRQLTNTSVVKVGYRGSRAWNQARLVDYNLAFPIGEVDGMPIFSTTPAVRNPNFTGIILAATDGDAFYNALLVELTKRFSSGVQFQGAYTLSKMIDDASSVRASVGAGVGAGNATSLEYRTYNRGLSAFDMRQNLVVNLSAELPFGADRRFKLSGLADALLGGWQVSSIGVFTSGRPVNVTMATTTATARIGSSGAGGGGRRPDLVAGGDNNPVLGGADQYFNPSQFTPAPGFRYGNLGRNTLIGPGMASVDMSVIKSFRVPAISEGMRISLRAEFFNLLDRANFSQPSAQVFDGQGRLIAAAGRITSTATSARQTQLGVRVTW